MRTALAILALASCLLLTLTTGSTAGRSHHLQLPADLRLQTGDVVLRHGNGLWSDLFARLNSRDTRFSHAGVVVYDGYAWYVVHAEADNFGRNGVVRMDEWTAFVKSAQQVALLRVSDPDTAARTAEAALVMHRDALPFDFSFDLTRLDAVYCSELVWRALSHALQRDPLPEKPILHGRDAVLVESLLLDLPELGVVYISDTDAAAHASDRHRR